ncbi:adenosine-deaminase (editase) domain-containing protein [Hirsutella rhossiliensis]|uniref:Adenosine-deaminase (Editase) domain-containing protein n=1 Tax=Hirsutella rhossiliensis TaxID=111463 RepID=A0A9P8MZL5_9HYPO|nr:adenosine-deaminase (editase) domain-containing protein [Hirsutella rhossiliensis]KAH0964149.1 adenosine-deaminase (editase) domain-containing protein [Hirsutella rhossiliensis]
MISRANRIAHAVTSQFNELPAKRKPSVRDNGVHEWVPLSGIVAEEDGCITCLALATGMKCLPASKLPEANGNGLHDWHAEVLALRAFNRLLLDQCKTLAEGCVPTAQVMEWARQGAPGEGHAPPSRPFRIREGVRLHMYCSEAPCGDASMELTMAAQDDASPWEPPTAATTPSTAAAAAEPSLPGRAYFSRLGIVRRKPSRADAPPTASKSCSDKLALKQCTSLLSSQTSLLVDLCYLDSLVLPASQYSATACHRAFSPDGRMAAALAAAATWSGDYAFRPFVVEMTDHVFDSSREAVRARAGDSISACNIAAAWSAAGVEESVIGGVLQGRKPFHEKGASRMSRRQMWRAASELADLLDGHGEIRDQLNRQRYWEVKTGQLLADRRAVKAAVRQTALAGWSASKEDTEFGKDVAD